MYYVNKQGYIKKNLNGPFFSSLPNTLHTQTHIFIGWHTIGGT